MQQGNPTETTGPIYSSLAGDPHFDELLEMFAESIAEKRQELDESFRSGQIDQVRAQAHQLKGVGGGYGFHGLTDVARELEEACKADDGDVDRIGEALDRVLSYMARVSV